MRQIRENLEQKLESQVKNFKGNLKALNERKNGQVQNLVHIVENIQSETEKQYQRRNEIVLFSRKWVLIIDYGKRAKKIKCHI
jgi:predicted transcriptional regulator with HTH domain